MFSKTYLVFVLTVFVFCESAFVDNLGKCDIDDGECEKNLIQSVIRDIAKTGIPELEIPRIDPIAINNVSVSILDVVDISLIQGNVKGIKDCIVDKFVTNVKKEHAVMELTCDVSVKGQYKVFSASPLIKNFLNGDTISGEGNGKVKIDKLHIKFDFYFFIQRRNNELYIKCKRDKTVYKYNIKGKMVFFADNLFIGKQESSKLLVGMLNENWQFIMSTFGTPFMDKAMTFVYDFLHKFFDNVPAKYYISNDLTPYARDQA